MDLEKVREVVQDWSIFGNAPQGPLPLKDKVVVRYEAESSEEEAAPKILVVPKSGTWVISTSRGTATLHIVGACFRKPGTHYSSWVPVHDPVSVDKFKRACRSCFKKGYPIINLTPAPVLVEALSEGMPESLITEETSESSSSRSD